jgi:hypothetical protein
MKLLGSTDNCDGIFGDWTCLVARRPFSAESLSTIDVFLTTAEAEFSLGRLEPKKSPPPLALCEVDGAAD